MPVPDLEQVFLALIELENLFVNDSDEHWTKVAFLVVLAARDELVKLVKGDLKHDLFQKLLRVAELILLSVQAPSLMDLANLLSVLCVDGCAKLSV